MTGLYFLALKRLQKLKPIGKTDVIRFPKVFEKLCSSFQIKKDDCWEILIALQEFGFLEIVRCQGIKINQRGDSNSW